MIVTCGLLVLSLFPVVGFVREQESTDWNPVYEAHEEDYDDNRTQVMDRNVEYVSYKF